MLKSVVVASYTTRFNIKKFRFLQIAFMRFLWLSEETAIFCLCIINSLVFITKTECVYCVVRTESLNVIEGQLSPQTLRRTFTFIVVMSIQLH
jgi:hypothetical protein